MCTHMTHTQKNENKTLEESEIILWKMVIPPKNNLQTQCKPTKILTPFSLFTEKEKIGLKFTGKCKTKSQRNTEQNK